MASIRKVFPIVLSIQITVAVGLTGWISFKSSESTVQQLTRNLCDNLNYRLEEQISEYFNTAVDMNKSVANAIKNGYIDPSNLKQGFQHIFQKYKEFDSKFHFFYGNENGSFIGIDRDLQNPTQLLMRIKEDGNTPNRPTYEINNNGERGKLVLNEQEYIVTQRPWYMAAKQAGREVWSSIFVSSIDGELTITRAIPFYNNNGILQGVTGISISLKQIKQFMLETRPNNKWNIFLVQGNGQIVATTSASPAFETKGNTTNLFEVSQSQDPLIQKAGVAVQREFGGFQNLTNIQSTEFEINGEKYIVSMHKLSKDLQLDWAIGVIVPKSIFMQEIDTTNRFTLMMIVAMLGVNIVLGLAISTWLLRPIKSLMQAAKQIEDDSFNPEKLDSVANRKDELGQMARLFQEMGNTITERHSGMKNQLSKLREEKEKATMAIIDSQMGLNNWAKSILSRSRSARNK